MCVGIRELDGHVYEYVFARYSHIYRNVCNLNLDTPKDMCRGHSTWCCDEWMARTSFAKAWSHYSARASIAADVELQFKFWQIPAA